MATGVPHGSRLAGSTAFLPGKLHGESDSNMQRDTSVLPSSYSQLMERHPDSRRSWIRVAATIFNIKDVYNYLLLIIYTAKMYLVLLLSGDVQCFIEDIAHRKDLTMLCYLTYSRCMAN